MKNCFYPHNNTFFFFFVNAIDVLVFVKNKLYVVIETLRQPRYFANQYTPI